MMNPSVWLGLAHGMVLLHTINFTGCEPKEILTVEKENVYVLDMKLVYFICSLVQYLKQLLAEQKQKQYSLNDEMGEAIDLCKIKRKIVLFSLSIQEVDFVVATKFTKIHSKNSLGCHS